MRLHALGWDAHFEDQWRRLATTEEVPARVTRQHLGQCTVLGEIGEYEAAYAGKLLRDASHSPPVCGDWVGIDLLSGIVARVLPRRSTLERKAPGAETRRHVLAANVDTLLVMMSPDRDFSTRRLERFLVLASYAGVRPIAVVTKADLVDNPQRLLDEISRQNDGIEALAISCLSGVGIDALQARLHSGDTVAMVGSSGVGKSRLLNALRPETDQSTRTLGRKNRRGRHTTTTRELFPMPGGWILMDMPGLREVQIWADESDVSSVFSEIDELAANCRFRNCTHSGEPGCAVQAALDEGGIEEQRLNNYSALLNEARFLETRTDERSRLEEKRRQKSLHKMYRRVKKEKPKLKG
jgi:ribosome biogenesis GTPase